MAKIEDAEKLASDKKAAVRYLRHMAEELEGKMAEHFVGGYYALASGEARLLAVVVDVLGQIDVR